MNTNDITALCRTYDIHDFTIRPDGKVDVHQSVGMPGLYDPTSFAKIVGHRPRIKFGKVVGDFRVGTASLDDMSWLPEEIGGTFDCSMSPSTSLSGIHLHIKYVGKYFFHPTECTHMLGIVNIRGIELISAGGSITSPPSDILNKYRGTGDILSAQDELIEAGFIEQARL